MDSVVIVLLSCLEDIKLLTEVINNGIEDKTDDHCDIVTQGIVKGRKCKLTQGLCDTVRYDITHRHLDNIAEDDPPVAALVAKCVVLIQKIAQYAAGEIVGNGGEPEAKVEKVKANEGNAVAEQGVDDPDDEKI